MKDSRELAHAHVADQLRWRSEPKVPKVLYLLHLRFMVPDRKQHDRDNLVAASKPLLDGFARALGFGTLKNSGDDCFDVLLVQVVRGCGGQRRVIAVLTPLGLAPSEWVASVVSGAVPRVAAKPRQLRESR